MKWQDRAKSSNVRKGSKANGGFGGSPRRSSGPIFIPRGGKGGLGSIIFILIIMFLLKGISGIGSDINNTNNQNMDNPKQYQNQSTDQANARDTLEDFLSVVLKDTEDVWHAKFEEMNAEYVEPTMVLFEESTRSACGVASSDMGPFYCPIDESIYIDVDFYRQLKNQFGAGGDFAFAYVLAHEVGHHVQNQLGILEKTSKLRQTLPTKEYNKYSVAQELQADYFGGLFAFYVEQKGYLDPGDIEEAMDAAASIGDDRIQEMSGRNVNVDTFTHGSSSQRKEAFDLGYRYHDINNSMVFFENIN